MTTYRTPFLCLLCVISTLALPTVRDNEKAELKAETKTKLEKELDKLSQDGVAVSKSEKVETKTVNGKTEQNKVEEQQISDAKTGQVVANVEKTVSTNDKGEQTKNVQIDLPGVGVHEELEGDNADNFELVSPDTAAQYIFDTQDYDGLQSAVDSMLDAKKITKKDAQSYVDQVKEHLNAINEESFQEYKNQMEEQRLAEDQAYQDMLELADALNMNFNTEQSLYVYVKKLYFLYKTEGDEYAKNLLSQYTNLIQQETEAGNINEAVQDNIYSIMLQALKDVNEELSKVSTGETTEEQQGEQKKPKEEKQKSTV